MNEPHTVSKASFDCLSFAVFTVLIAVELVGGLVLARILRHVVEIPPSWGGTAGWLGAGALPNLFFARVAVDRLCKVFGLSRSGITREIQGRSVALPERPADEEAAVAVHASHSTCRVLMVLSLVMLLFISLFVKHSAPGELGLMVYWGYFLIAFSAFGVVFFGVLPFIPLVRADAEGIRGEGFAAFSKFIPWSEVATCEITTVFNTVGNRVLVQPTLKDKHGEKLLRFDLWFARLEEKDRLVKYIKTKLPKPQLDSWDSERDFCP